MPPASDQDVSPVTGPLRTGWAMAAAAGWAAAAIGAVVAAVLVVGHARSRRADLPNAPNLAALRSQLAQKPKDEALKERIRELDLRLRKDHFRHLTIARWGNALLVGCLVVFLVGVRSAIARAWRPRRPRGETPDTVHEMRAATRGRTVVGAVAAVLAAGAISPAALEIYRRWTTAPPPPPHVADPALVAKYWTQFRGPGAQGVSAYTNVPTDWDANTNRNIAWKSPIPLPGKSSPVVWGDRIFLTGATRVKRQVYCYEAGTGKRLWSADVVVPGSAKTKEAFEDTGYAAPTPVVNDRHVFAVFTNGDLACFDFAGQRVWTKTLGTPQNQYSHGSSLVMYRNLLLVLWDQGALEDYMSRLLAFDGQTGRLIWQVRRSVSSSWATPALVAGKTGQQLITSANPWVLSYDPNTGAERWRAKCMEGGDVASTVAWANGVAYAVCAETELSALRTDLRGDVTKTGVLWSADEGLPDITSPLTNGRFVWLIETGGRLVCYDAKTGKKAYEHEFEKIFNASPALAGEKVYLVTTKGVAYVLDAGGAFKLLQTNFLGEPVHASPVFQDGRIYLRGKKHLYCIANTKPGS